MLSKLCVCSTAVRVTIHVMKGLQWWCRVENAMLCVAVEGAGTRSAIAQNSQAKQE